MRRHRDDGRVAQRKDRRWIVEQVDPDRRAEHDERHGQQRAGDDARQTAPAVLKRRQTIDSSSGGKLALQAMANARPTMKATFCPLNRMPSSTASDAEHDRRSARDPHLLVLRSRWPSPNDVHEDVVRQRAGAGERQAGDDREDRRERHGGDEAEERRAAEQLRDERRRHVAAGDRRCAMTLAADQRRRAEADDRDDQVEVADEAGRVEHRRARRRASGTV